MIRFNLFGFPVTIQPFFWLTMALIGGILRATTPESYLRVALIMLAGLVSILVHELGHSLAGRHFGRPSTITLHAFGGFAQFGGGPFAKNQAIVVTAAGPVIQIVLGVAGLVLVRWLPPLSPNAGIFLTYLIWVSFVWAIFNMLPIIPMDGGMILKEILGPGRLEVALWVTIVTAGVVGVLMWMMLRSWIAPIFMGMFAWQAWQALRERRGR